MPHQEKTKMADTLSLYIHIPFCVRKCRYCDFVSGPWLDQKELYLQSVCEEIAQTDFSCRQVDTVFIGGGTPTLLKCQEMERILNAVHARFSVSAHAEISMEANPGTVSEEKLKHYHEMGINRLSLGIQSFSDRMLRTLGRIHSGQEAVKAVSWAREAGFDNLNMDLMYGLPEQSTKEFESTLATALSMHPEHLSLYSLILEEGTPFYQEAQAGTLILPGEEEVLAMERMAGQFLQQNGYERYEVSNFAQKGMECRHNLVYWECLPYLGFGPGAHSDAGRRFYNEESIDKWVQQVRGKAVIKEGNGSWQERAFERMMMGLRLVRGVDCCRFYKDFGMLPEERWPNSIRKFLKAGLLVQDAGRLRCSERGMDVLNSILTYLLEEQDEAECPNSTFQ